MNAAKGARAVALVSPLVLGGCFLGMTVGKMASRPLPVGPDPAASIPFESFQVDHETVVDAYKYALDELGIGIHLEERVADDALMMVAHLGTGFQSWGQFIRIVVTQPGADGSVRAYYESERKLSMNVTEDLFTVGRNVKVHVDNFLLAAEEGVDIRELAKPDTSGVADPNGTGR